MKMTNEQQRLAIDLLPIGRRLAAKYCPGDEDADSIADLAVCEAVAEFNPSRGTNPDSYVRVRVRNDLVDYIRKKREYVSLATPIPGTNGLTIGHTLPQAADPTVSSLEWGAALSVLPKQYREIFSARYEKNMTVKRIIGIYGVSRATVYRILERCKSRLRREIDG